jgi:hypothetical protein
MIYFHPQTCFPALTTTPSGGRRGSTLFVVLAAFLFNRKQQTNKAKYKTEKKQSCVTDL